MIDTHDFFAANRTQAASFDSNSLLDVWRAKPDAKQVFDTVIQHPVMQQAFLEMAGRSIAEQQRILAEELDRS